MPMMTRARRYLAVAVLLTAAACGDEQSARLIGSWRQTTGTTTQTYKFSSDNTLMFDQVNQDGVVLTRQTGIYTARDQQLVLDVRDTNGAREVLDIEYYVNRDALYFAPLLPVGRHQGIVGTWHGLVSRTLFDSNGQMQSQTRSELTLNLLADGSANGDYSAVNPSTLSGGSWRNDTTTTVNGYVISFTDLTFSFQLIDDAILGQRPFARVP